ncbi:ubiquitin-protein ligase E3 [Phellopilus nigrolimitatus]|nr:ubiquitin-protein ligase E3 [Phellopilus nigrolimitatus]
MDGPLKELDKLQKLTAFTSEPFSLHSILSIPTAVALNGGKGKHTTSIVDALDGLLAALRDVKERVESGTASEEDVANVAKIVEERKKEIEERQKEIHASLGRVGKALDKKFTNSVPEMPSLFTSAEAQEALQRTIALHFLRTGQFSTADTFLEESSADVPPETKSQFRGLYRVLTALRGQDIAPALNWCRENRVFLEKRGSPLEFNLHRSQFMRLLLASNPPNAIHALLYARTSLQPLYPVYATEINRLLACIAYLPLTRLQSSPYADLASPSLHLDLEPMFAKEYCANLGMSRQVPLRIVGDIGGGGALARIEKGRKVMRERKSEWSQTDELPIEIPLPPENRYHSIFACPVSKEQATSSNPPMMMTCGHVVASDSLAKLAKSQGRVKCPYCPQESQQSSALKVYF